MNLFPEPEPEVNISFNGGKKIKLINFKINKNLELIKEENRKLELEIQKQELEIIKEKNRKYELEIKIKELEIEKEKRELDKEEEEKYWNQLEILYFNVKNHRIFKIRNRKMIKNIDDESKQELIDECQSDKEKNNIIRILKDISE